MEADLLSLKDAAQRLGVVTPTLLRWERAGKLRTVRTPGGWRRVPESEVTRLMVEGESKKADK